MRTVVPAVCNDLSRGRLSPYDGNTSFKFHRHLAAFGEDRYTCLRPTCSSHSDRRIAVSRGTLPDAVPSLRLRSTVSPSAQQPPTTVPSRAFPLCLFRLSSAEGGHRAKKAYGRWLVHPHCQDVSPSPCLERRSVLVFQAPDPARQLRHRASPPIADRRKRNSNLNV